MWQAILLTGMTSAVWNMGEPGTMRAMAIRNPLATSLLLSLIIHLCCYGFYQAGKQHGWWDYQATWLLNRSKKKAAMLAQQARQRQAIQQQREVPLEFVEVDPALAAVEAPKDAKYYGAHNAVAANPDASIETVTPKMDGKQNKMMRTEDVPKPKPFPLQPAPEAPAEPKPKAAENPGDLTKARPEPLTQPSDTVDLGAGAAPAKRERPRLLAQVDPERRLAGKKTMQDGGVRTRGRLSPNVKGTLFGSYDAALIAAVQQRWYDLLETTPFLPRSGKVVIEFRLHQDGRVTDMQMSANDVGDILALKCEQAIKEPSPFGKWPDDMRRMVGNTYREVMFTFYYD